MGCFSREEKGYVEETAKWDYIVSYLPWLTTSEGILTAQTDIR